MPRNGPALPLTRPEPGTQPIDSLIRVSLNDDNRRPYALDRIAEDWLP